MKWLLIIILFIIIWLPAHFLINMYMQRKWLASKGGIKVAYKTIIDGLLDYSSARIVEDKKSFIKIGGFYTDCISNRECGIWTVFIMPNPPYKLNVLVQANINLGSGEKINKEWSFPTNLDQHQILSIIKKKVDEFDDYGIYK